MARKAEPGTLIHCEYCGEDYSATYKRCPFCGEKPSSGAFTTIVSRPPIEELEDEYIFEGQDLFDDGGVEDEEPLRPASPRGGKRLAQNDAAGPVNWPRLITFVCSLVMIAAALVILFVYFFPKIHDPGKTPTAENPSGAVSPSPVQPSPSVPSQPAQPSADPSEAVTAEPSAEPSQPAGSFGAEGVVVNVSNSLNVRSGPGTSYDKVGKLKNGDHVTVMSDAGEGWYEITFGDETGYIKGEYISVNGEPAPTPTPAPTPVPTPTPSATPSPSPSNSGGLAAGSKGYITDVSQTLRVRSGPGTSYEKVGNLKTGDPVTVESDAGDGWYKISYSGGTGYIKGEFISTKAPGTSASPAPSPSASSGLKAGAKGSVTGASGGLRVRSGPGTSHENIGSLRNGDPVTILSDAGDGWYEISYAGSDGTVKGYIKGEFISVP